MPLSSIEVIGSPSSSSILPRENSSLRELSSEDIPSQSLTKIKGEGSYIFKEGLFTRVLLPEISGREREYLVSCTT